YQSQGIELPASLENIIDEQNAVVAERINGFAFPYEGSDEHRIRIVTDVFMAYNTEYFMGQETYAARTDRMHPVHVVKLLGMVLGRQPNFVEYAAGLLHDSDRVALNPVPKISGAYDEWVRKQYVHPLHSARFAREILTRLKIATPREIHDIVWIIARHDMELNKGVSFAGRTLMRPVTAHHRLRASVEAVVNADKLSFFDSTIGLFVHDRRDRLEHVITRVVSNLMQLTPYWRREAVALAAYNFKDDGLVQDVLRQALKQIEDDPASSPIENTGLQERGVEIPAAVIKESLDRGDIQGLYRRIGEFIGVKGAVVDVGCSSNWLPLRGMLAAGAERAYGVDVFERRADVANVDIRVADAAQGLPFEPESVEAVIFHRSLIHIIKSRRGEDVLDIVDAVMQHAVRIVKPDGWIVIFQNPVLDGGALPETAALANFMDTRKYQQLNIPADNIHLFLIHKLPLERDGRSGAGDPTTSSPVSLAPGLKKKMTRKPFISSELAGQLQHKAEWNVNGIRGSPVKKSIFALLAALAMLLPGLADGQQLKSITEPPPFGSLYASVQQVEIATVLKSRGYPEAKIPELIRLLEDLFQEINFNSLKKELQNKDSQKLNLALAHLIAAVDEKGYLNTKQPKALLKLLVNALNLKNEDVFRVLQESRLSPEAKEDQQRHLVSCATLSQLADILMKIAGVETRAVYSVSLIRNQGHIFLLVPVNTGCFVWVDFVNKTVREMDFLNYYRQEGKYRILAPDQRLDLARLKDNLALLLPDLDVLSDKEWLNFIANHVLVTETPEGTLISASILDNLGVMYETVLGQPETALKAFKTAVQLNPDFAEAYYNLGNVYSDLGQPSDAMKAYKLAVRLNPNFAEAHYNLGLAYTACGQYVEAIKVYQSAVRLDSHMTEAHFNLGRAYFAVHQYPEAIKAYQRAIQLNPGFAPSYNSLGITYNTTGQSSEAIKAFETAIRLDSGFAIAYNNLGNAYLALNQSAEAIHAYQTAIQRNPNDVNFHYNLGVVYSRIKKYQPAIAAFREANRINPRYADARNALEQVLAEVEQRTRQIQKKKEWLKSYPADVNAYVELSRAHYALGHYEEVISIFKELIKRQPNEPKYYFTLGIVYKELGQRQEAVKNFKKAVELKPAFINEVPAELRNEVEGRKSGNVVPNRPQEGSGSSPVLNGRMSRGREASSPLVLDAEFISAALRAIVPERFQPVADGRMIRKAVWAFVLRKDPDDLKLLFIKRSPEMPFYRNVWAYVGGGIQEAETDKEAVLRETKEETGLEVELLGRLSDVLAPEGDYIISPFVVYARGGEFRPSSEISEWEWISVKELLEAGAPEALANKKGWSTLSALSQFMTALAAWPGSKAPADSSASEIFKAEMVRGSRLPVSPEVRRVLEEINRLKSPAYLSEAGANFRDYHDYLGRFRIYNWVLRLELLHHLGILKGNLLYFMLGNDYFPSYFATTFGTNYNHALRGETAIGKLLDELENKAIAEGLPVSYRGREKRIKIYDGNQYDTPAYFSDIQARGGVDVILVKGMTAYSRMRVEDTPRLEGMNEGRVERNIEALLRTAVSQLLRDDGFVILAHPEDLWLEKSLVEESGFADVVTRPAFAALQETMGRPGLFSDDYFGRKTDLVAGEMPLRAFQKKVSSPVTEPRLWANNGEVSWEAVQRFVTSAAFMKVFFNALTRQGLLAPQYRKQYCTITSWVLGQVLCRRLALPRLADDGGFYLEIVCGIHAVSPFSGGTHYWLALRKAGEERALWISGSESQYNDAYERRILAEPYDTAKARHSFYEMPEIFFPLAQEYFLSKGKAAATPEEYLMWCRDLSDNLDWHEETPRDTAEILRVYEIYLWRERLRNEGVWPTLGQASPRAEEALQNILRAPVVRAFKSSAGRQEEGPASSPVKQEGQGAFVDRVREAIVRFIKKHIEVSEVSLEDDVGYYQTVIDWVKYILGNYQSRFGGHKLVFIGGSCLRPYQAALSLGRQYGVDEENIVYLDMPRAVLDNTPDALLRAYLNQRGLFNGEGPIAIFDDFVSDGKTIKKLQTVIHSVNPAIEQIFYPLLYPRSWPLRREKSYWSEFPELGRKPLDTAIFLHGDAKTRDVRRKILVAYEEMPGAVKPVYLNTGELNQFLLEIGDHTPLAKVDAKNLSVKAQKAFPLVEKMLAKITRYDVFDPREGYIELKAWCASNPGDEADRQDRLFLSLLENEKASSPVKQAPEEFDVRPAVSAIKKAFLDVRQKNINADTLPRDGKSVVRVIAGRLVNKEEIGVPLDTWSACLALTKGQESAFLLSMLQNIEQHVPEAVAAVIRTERRAPQGETYSELSVIDNGSGFVDKEGRRISIQNAILGTFPKEKGELGISLRRSVYQADVTLIEVPGETAVIRSFSHEPGKNYITGSRIEWLWANAHVRGTAITGYFHEGDAAEVSVWQDSLIEGLIRNPGRTSSPVSQEQDRVAFYAKFYADLFGVGIKVSVENIHLRRIIPTNRALSRETVKRYTPYWKEMLHDEPPIVLRDLVGQADYLIDGHHQSLGALLSNDGADVAVTGYILTPVKTVSFAGLETWITANNMRSLEVFIAPYYQNNDGQALRPEHPLKELASSPLGRPAKIGVQEGLVHEDDMLVFHPGVPLVVPPRYSRIIFKKNGVEISRKESGEKLSEEELFFVRNAPMVSFSNKVDPDIFEIYNTELFEQEKIVTVEVPEDIREFRATTIDVINAAVHRKPVVKETGINIYLALFLEAIQNHVSPVHHAIVIGSYGWGTYALGDDLDFAVVTEDDIPETAFDALAPWWNHLNLPYPSFVYSTRRWIQNRLKTQSKDYFERLLELKKFIYYSEVVGPNRNIINELRQLRRDMMAEKYNGKITEETLVQLRELVKPLKISSSPVCHPSIGGDALISWAREFGLIVSVADNNLLAQALAAQSGIPYSSLGFERFADREGRLVVSQPEMIEGRDVLIVHNMDQDGDEKFVQLLLILAGMRDFGAAHVQVLIPQSMRRRSRDLIHVLRKFAAVHTLPNLYFSGENMLGARVRAYRRPLWSFVKVVLNQVSGRIWALRGRFLRLPDIEILLFTRSRALLHKKVAQIVEPAVKVERVDIRTLKRIRRTKVQFSRSGVRGKNVLLFHTTKTDRGLVQLVLTLNRLRESGAGQVSLLLGYMGYARGHENYPAPEYGPTAQAVNAAKFILEMIRKFADELITVNVHFFKQPDEDRFQYLKNPRCFTRQPSPEETEFLDFRIRNLNALDLLVRYYLKGGFNMTRPVLVAPDYGIYAFVKDAADPLGLESGYLKKKRLDSYHVEQSEEVYDAEGNRLDVRGRDIIILDDIIAGGSTTIGAATILRSLGARRVMAGAVHGIFIKGTEMFLQVLDHVVSTDSVITERSQVSLAELIVDYLGYGHSLRQEKTGRDTGDSESSLSSSPIKSFSAVEDHFQRVNVLRQEVAAHRGQILLWVHPLFTEEFLNNPQRFVRPYWLHARAIELVKGPVLKKHNRFMKQLLAFVKAYDGPVFVLVGVSLVPQVEQLFERHRLSGIYIQTANADPTPLPVDSWKRNGDSDPWYGLRNFFGEDLGVRSITVVGEVHENGRNCVVDAKDGLVALNAQLHPWLTFPEGMDTTPRRHSIRDCVTAVKQFLVDTRSRRLDAESETIVVSSEKETFLSGNPSEREKNTSSPVRQLQEQKDLLVLRDQLVREINDVILLKEKLPRSVTSYGGNEVKPGTLEYTLGVFFGQALFEAGLTPCTGGGPGLMHAILSGYRQARGPLTPEETFFLRLALDRMKDMPPEMTRKIFTQKTQGFKLYIKGQTLNDAVEVHRYYTHFVPRKMSLLRNALVVNVGVGGFGTKDEFDESLRAGVPVFANEVWQPVIDSMRERWGFYGWRESHMPEIRYYPSPNKLPRLVQREYLRAVSEDQNNEKAKEIINQYLLQVARSVVRHMREVLQEGAQENGEIPYTVEALYETRAEIIRALPVLNAWPRAVVIIGSRRLQEDNPRHKHDLDMARAAVRYAVDQNIPVRVVGTGPLAKAVVDEIMRTEDPARREEYLKTRLQGIFYTGHPKMNRRAVARKFNPANVIETGDPYVLKLLLTEKVLGHLILPGRLGTFDVLSEIAVFHHVQYLQSGQLYPKPLALIGAAFWQPYKDILMETIRPYALPGSDQIFRVTDTGEQLMRVMEDIVIQMEKANRTDKGNGRDNSLAPDNGQAFSSPIDSRIVSEGHKAAGKDCPVVPSRKVLDKEMILVTLFFPNIEDKEENIEVVFVAMTQLLNKAMLFVRFLLSFITQILKRAWLSLGRWVERVSVDYTSGHDARFQEGSLRWIEPASLSAAYRRPVGASTVMSSSPVSAEEYAAYMRGQVATKETVGASTVMSSSPVSLEEYRQYRDEGVSLDSAVRDAPLIVPAAGESVVPLLQPVIPFGMPLFSETGPVFQQKSVGPESAVLARLHEGVGRDAGVLAALSSPVSQKNKEKHANGGFWRKDFSYNFISRSVRELKQYKKESHIQGGIAVFGSARKNSVAAETLARMLAEAGHFIITGGGPGVMESANRGAALAGGVSVGLAITLPFEEAWNPYVKTGLQFKYFFSRLVTFVKLSQAGIFEYGGFGTLNELMTMLALKQRGILDRNM
ncbi:MAG TPA: tetratricopeptide repeat protein, partial [Candidatus Omnitrophota bacterium]|nr:tetratricopeptide repeat protein [Candidatus Omnitrophota bacterium]